jgi:hypothetical protein
MKFDIKMKNKKITFEDIIDLTDEQQETIKEYAKNFNSKEILDSESGVKIELENYQREIVLAQKNSLLGVKDETALLTKGTITFTKHAKARIAVRVCKFDTQQEPSLDSILLIIRLVIDSEVVDKSAEWKGRNNLVFTLIHSYLHEEFKVSVSFENRGSEILKVITVTNDHIDQLYTKLLDNHEMMEKLKGFKERVLQVKKQPQS